LLQPRANFLEADKFARMIRPSTGAALFLAFCGWVVFTAGLAAMQHDCPASGGATSGIAAIRGYSSVLGCNRLFRYYWWIMAYEFVIIIGATSAVASPIFHQNKLLWIALFTIAAMLYIQASDTFLTTTETGYWNGPGYHRSACTAAGAIITAAANFLVLIAMASWLHPAGANNGVYGKRGVPGTTTAAPGTTTTTGMQAV